MQSLTEQLGVLAMNFACTIVHFVVAQSITSATIPLLRLATNSTPRISHRVNAVHDEDEGDRDNIDRTGASAPTGRRDVGTENASPPEGQHIGSASDVILLMQTLVEHERMGGDHVQALKALAGRNGHTAQEWTDLYVRNAAQILHSPCGAAGSGSNQQCSAEIAETSRHQIMNEGPQLASRPICPKSHPEIDASPVPPVTVDTCYSPRRRLLPKHSEADLMVMLHLAPPYLGARESPGYYRLDSEDKVFVKRFIRWVLENNPRLPNIAISRLMTLQAPHRTAGAWGFVLNKYRPFIGKVIQEVLDSGEPDVFEHDPGEGEDESRGFPPGGCYPQERCTRRQHVDHRGDCRPLDLHLSDEGDVISNVTQDRARDPVRPRSRRRRFGGPRMKFTEGEKRLMAEYVALKAATWDDGGRRMVDWEEFSMKHPQRSKKGWTNIYRYQNYEEINKVADRYREEARDARTRRGTGNTGLRRKRPAVRVVIDLTRPTPPPERGDGERRS